MFIPPKAPPQPDDELARGIVAAEYGLSLIHI